MREIDNVGGMAFLGRGGRGVWRRFDFIEIGENSPGAVGSALENRERPLPGVSGRGVEAISIFAGEYHDENKCR